MEDLSPLILEISSDEEVGFGDIRGGGGYGGGVGEFGDRDDCDWLSELLGVVGGDDKDDDSDEVVVVSEVFANPAKKPRFEATKPSAKGVGDEGDDDDDDCVVLDCDPDKPVVVANGRADKDDGHDGDGSDDELEIVGEKGEVACRDFPHARHLCAKFLFGSTPHDSHCGQCHCYVCDSLAPCAHWGTGVSSIDHCHATDKDEYWRAERKRVKKGDKSVPYVQPIPSINYTSGVGGPFFRPTQAPPQPNSFPQNSALRPVRVHFPPVPSNASVPNVIHQGRAHPSRIAVRPVPICTPRPQFVPLQSHHRTCNSNTAIRKSHFYKRLGYKSQFSGDSLKRCREFQTPVMYGPHGANQRKNISSGPVLSAQHQRRSSYLQNIKVGRANYLPAQPQKHFRPCVNNNFANSPVQPQFAPRPSVQNFEHPILPQQNVCRPNSSTPFQAVASYPSDAWNTFGNELNSNFTTISNHSAGINFENQSSQPWAYSKASSPFDVPNNFQQANCTQSGIDKSVGGFGRGWDNFLGPDNSQHPSVGKNDLHHGVDPVDNSHQLGVTIASFSKINDADCQFPESTTPNALDFEFDSWMFENHPLAEELEVPISPVWNSFPPESASIDTGNLFDY